MPDVFISYSRRDDTFVRGLHSRLTDSGKDVWVDWEDIPPASKFEADLDEGVAESHAFVFVMSPDSVRSDYCRRELDRATELQKRILPLLYRPVDGVSLPEPLNVHNWIPNRGRFEDAYDDTYDDLVRAIDTDLDWVREHTHWGNRAGQWEASGRDRSLLLRGAELRSAEAWLGRRAGKEPAPTALDDEFVSASRAGERRRQRRTIGAAALAVAVSAALAVVAVVQRNTARSEKELATARQLASASEASLGSDPELSLLLGLESAKLRRTSAASHALRLALRDSRVTASMRGHANGINTAVPSRDGRLVVTGSGDRTVRIWRGSDGAPLRRLTGFAGAVDDVALSADGRLLATAAVDDGVRVFETRTGRELARLGPRAAATYDVEFSPDGRRLAAAAGDAGRIWRVRDRTLAAQLRPPATEVITAIAFSPDGRIVATNGTRPRAWSARSGRLVAGARLPRGGLLGGDTPAGDTVLFSADGKRVLSTGPLGQAWTWSPATGEVLTRFATPRESNIVNADLSPDGRLVATGSATGGVALWRSTTGKRAGPQLATQRNYVTGVRFSPDGTSFVSAADDVRVWRVGHAAPISLRGHVGSVTGASFMPGGQRVLSWSADRTSRIWDARHRPQPLPTRTATLAEVGTSADSVELSPAGRGALAVGRSGRVSVWRGDGTRGRRLPGCSSEGLEEAHLAAGGRMVTTVVGARRSVVCDARTGRVLARYGGKAAVSPDGSLVVVARGRDVRIRRFPNGDQVADLGRQRDPFQRARFSPDGRLVVLVAGFVARVYDRDGKRLAEVGLNREVERITGRGGTISSAEFSPDSKLVLTDGGDVRLWQVWDAHGGRKLATFAKFSPVGGPLGTALFSPDTSRLVTADPAALPRLWDPRSGDLVRALPELRRASYAAFSPAGDLVAAVSELGGSIYVWETDSGQALALGRWPRAIVKAIEFGPGPGRLTVAGMDPSFTPVIRRYACELCGSLSRLVAMARTRVGRGLSAAERKRFGL